MKNKASLVRLNLPRMIKNNLRAFIALVAVAAVGIALLVALNNAHNRLQDSVDAFRENYSDADITLTVNASNADVRDALLAIDGVERVNARLVYDASVKKPDGRIVTLRFYAYDEGDFPLVTIEGRAVASEGEIPVAVAERFAQRNDVSAGDSLTILLGGREYPVAVSGIATTPEGMKIKRDIYMWYDDIDFGYAFIARQDLEALTGLRGFYNQVLILTRDGSDDEAILQKALAIMGECGVSVIDGSDYENSTMRKWVTSMITPIRIIGSILPPVFFAVTLMFLYISLSQTIGRNRKNIGTLRALGFKKREILPLFASYALVITVIASALGIVGGVLLSELIYSMYTKNMLVPAIAGGVNPWVCVVGVLTCLATGQAASLLLSRQVAKISAAASMRPATAESGETPLLLRTVLKGLNSRAKLMAATILRKKQRFLLSTISLASATFLILLSLALMFSQNSILNHTFQKRMRYDAQVRFTTDIDAPKQAQIQSLPEVRQCDFALVFTSPVGPEGDVLMICGLNKDVSLISIFDENYLEIPLPEDGIALEKNFAGDFGIRAGDTVKIGDEEVPVSAISAEDINYIQYCPYELAARISGLEAPNMVFCEIAQGVTQEEFLNAMIKIEGCAGVTFCDKQYESGKSNMDLVNVAMTIIIACAMTIGFVIVYNTSLYSYTDWEREYAILRSEGFRVCQVALVCVTEVFFEYIASLMISLPLGLFASAYMLNILRDQTISYPLADAAQMCCLTALIMLLFIAYGLLLSVARLKRMNIAMVIKPN